MPTSRPTKTTAFPALPAETSSPASAKHICMVLHECLGPTQNNGLGTAYTLLGEALAAAGHDITFLYATTRCAQHDLNYWADDYKKRAINFVVLRQDDQRSPQTPDWLTIPYLVYRWLKDKDFDIIHYPEYPGNGYFLALAKHQGLAFSNTLLCLGTHGPSMWSRAANGYAINAVRHLAIDFMERTTAALSDVLISPGQSLLHWMLLQGWILPTATYVQQNIQSPFALALGAQPASSPQPFKNIVFFGRIEPRKGYRLFCDALDLLPHDLVQGVHITFLGASTQLYEGDSAEEVKQRAAKWPCTTLIVSDSTQRDSLNYLRDHHCLAVMPSLDDVTPYAVLECIGAQIPFLTSHAGGIPELIAPEDRVRVCFHPVRADVLAVRLETALRQGLAPARPAIAPDVTRQEWIDWHKGVQQKLPSDSATSTHEKPLITGIILGDTHAAETQESLRQQTYPLGDMLHISNGASLSATLRQVQGNYIAIMESGDILAPHHLATSLHVAERTGASIITAAYTYDDKLQVFLGGTLAVGAFRNIFGSSNALIRRDVIEALGGFNEELGTKNMFWDFYRRAVAAGFKLEAIPDTLFHRTKPEAAELVEHPYDPATVRLYQDHLHEGLKRMMFGAAPHERF